MSWEVMDHSDDSNVPIRYGRVCQPVASVTFEA